MTRYEEDPVVWLQKLIACPSINPRGGPVDAPPFGEHRLNTMLADELNGWGAAIELHEVMPGRTNLLARFAGQRRDRCLMLECHSDTVPVDGMTIAPFTPQIRDGRLYGRGACDTKGAMAAMLAGLAKVLTADGAPPSNVCFVATCNEEQGATGAQALMQSGFRADAAIVGEPTALRIVDAHKGAIRFEIRVDGRAAHSSDPSLGINAISKMAAVIARIDGSLADELARVSHPRLGSPVVSVGIIHGGSLVNVIPERCIIEIDRRLLPGETAATATTQLQAHLDALAAIDPNLRCQVRQTQYYAPLEANPQSPFGRQLAESVRTITGRLEYEAAPWGSDAGAYHAAGIPVFVFGPGSIRQAHSADEYVDLDQLTTASAVYADIIRRFND